jgi:hypothetical protein
MKVLPIGLGLAGIALLGFAIGLGIWAGMPPNPLTTLLILVGQAMVLPKLVYLLLFGQVIWIAVLGLGVLKGRSEPDTTALTILSFAPPGLGLAATLLSCLYVHVAMENTHTTELRVVAPSLAEALAPFAIGLLVGAAAAMLRVKAVDRPKPASA